MSAIILQGNTRVAHLDVRDRGLAYGDGIFETILVADFELIWWAEHWSRLKRSAARLSIQLPDELTVRCAAQSLICHARGLVKIILTRGVAGRGYAPTASEPTCIISLYPAPERTTRTIAVRWCDTVLSTQPALAGMKHLNRLENVMARAEWNTEAYAEGLLCDAQGQVICATSANVFIYTQQQWCTPDVSQAGIAGLARDWFIAYIGTVQIGAVSRMQVEQASAVFLCNSVRGLLEVRQIGDVHYAEQPELIRLKQQFLTIHPAFDAQ